MSSPYDFIFISGYVIRFITIIVVPFYFICIFPKIKNNEIFENQDKHLIIRVMTLFYYVCFMIILFITVDSFMINRLLSQDTLVYKEWGIVHLILITIYIPIIIICYIFSCIFNMFHDCFTCCETNV